MRPVAGERGEAVGLIGLGNMGSALAGRLAERTEVVGYDLDGERCAAAAAAGVRIADTPRAVAEQATTVLFSLPRPEISRGVLGELVPIFDGGLVIETSTVSPADARAMHAEARAGGAGFVDAAILSGVAEVTSGRSAFLVGGDEPDVKRAEPVLASVCERIVRFGAPGTGMAAKVINNAVAHATMVVLAEAAALAEAEGIELDVLCRLLEEDDAGVKRPLTERLAGRVAAGDFEGGMPMEAARKDSALALDLARSRGVPLFAMQASDSVYELALGRGLARQDYAAIASLWWPTPAPTRSA
jgi:3-hydroxyisobutyrate dehydrogenase-like beta-hydroxyacid dehydrogenase